LSAGGARLLAAFAGVTLLVFADLRTKSWAGGELRARGPRTVAGGLRLHYQENRGSVFRPGPRPAILMLSDAALSLALLGLLVQQSVRGRGGLLLLGVVALLGGLLGNLRDRMDHGFVIDFIEAGRWPVFNVADVCLALGLTASVAGLISRPRTGEG
jgi:signal peptidase II